MSTELFSTLPYKVADITLADFGRKEIDLAEKEYTVFTIRSIGINEFLPRSDTMMAKAASVSFIWIAPF